MVKQGAVEEVVVKAGGEAGAPPLVDYHLEQWIVICHEDALTEAALTDDTRTDASSSPEVRAAAASGLQRGHLA